MPLYAFRCTHCEAEHEETRSIADRDAPLACPAPIATKSRYDSATCGYPLKRIMALTADPRLGGREGIARRHNALVKRSLDHEKTDVAQTERATALHRMRTKYKLPV